MSEEERTVDMGSGRLSHSTRLAAEYLADVVQNHHGTKNGRTALYWAVIATILTHAADPPKETPQ